MNQHDRIDVNPKICDGKPCIKGTRVMVSVILDNLAEGETYESIEEGYKITREDIQASLEFAADLASDRFIPLETGLAK